MVDIQGFVHVALTTAAGGEDDLAHDRLHNLRTVGSGFASLIYDVETSDGYLELMHKCESLWRVLRTNPELPKLLVSTFREACMCFRSPKGPVVSQA